MAAMKSAGLDYIRLMSGKEDPLLLLVPVLSSTNVHVIAKLAGKIPCDDGRTALTPGMIFCAFALKSFWKDEQPMKVRINPKTLLGIL